MEKNSIIDAQEELTRQTGEAPPLPNDPEWEMYQEMCAQMEEADNELSDKPSKPKHCPIPKDDIIVGG